MSEQKRYAQNYSQSADFWSDDEVQAPVVARSNAPVLPERRPAIKAQALDSLRGAMAATPPPQVIQIGAPQRTDHTGHARSDDNAVSIASASLLYSVAYGLIFAGILIPVALIAVFAFGMDGAAVGMGALILWGAVAMFALNRNRAQGLRHSPTGVAHAQNESDEDVRHHQIESNERIALAETEIRRAIAAGYLALLEKINDDAD